MNVYHYINNILIYVISVFIIPLFNFTTSLWRGLKLGVKYVSADIKRNKKNAIIGIFTIVLVVSYVSLLQNAISQSPIIFMKVAENEVGELDLILTPQVNNIGTSNDQSSDDPYSESNDSYSYDNEDEDDSSSDNIKLWVNQTEISDKLKYVDSVIGSAPRWTMLGRVYNANNHTFNGTVIILIIDSELEKEAQIGRDWNYRSLNYEETYVTSSALRQIGVKANAGERVHVGFDFLQLAKSFGGFNEDMVIDLLSQVIEDSLQDQNITIDEREFLDFFGLNEDNKPSFLPSPNENGDIVIDLSNIPDDVVHDIVSQFVTDNWDEIESRISSDKLYIECTVVDGIDNPAGKWPKSLGNVAVLESKYLLKSLSNIIPDNLLIQDFIAQSLGLKDPNDNELYNLKDYIQSIDINSYALMVIVQYTNRFITYIKETSGMDADMILFTNDIVEAIGVYYPVELQLPIQELLVGLNYLRMFLDQVFNSVLVILVGMGIMLIYSLLLSDVEDKTYEYGMLRALGLPHNALIELLLIQSIFYSVPGIIIGLILSFVLSIPISYIMAGYATVEPTYRLSPSAIYIGLFLGIFMPIISNIIPIKRALSHTLRDSLDVYHQTSQQINVQIVKLESLGLNPWQIVSAIMMVSVGFIIYYIVPLTFIFLNISLFLTILNGILLGMLIGATIVATLFQPVLERQVLKLLLWGRERNLETLIQKSLAGHRSRNRKTAMMYSICLAFIIFSGAMFTLQTKAILANVKLGIGSDIVFLAATTKSPLPEDDMRNFLELQLQQNEENKIVIGYSFLTYSMWDMDDVRANYVTNLADFPWHRLNLYGLEENFLNVVYGDYYVPTEFVNQFDYNGIFDDHSKPDLVKSLYTDSGNQVLPIEKMGIDIPVSIMTSQGIGVNDGETSFYYRTNNETYTQYIDVLSSEGLRYGSYVNTDTPVKMDVSAKYINHNSVSIKFLIKIRGMISKMSGFFFSSYPDLAGGSPLLLSMDKYQDVLDHIYEIKRHGYLALGYSAEETNTLLGDIYVTPPKQRLFIRLKEDVTLTERELIINGLRNYIEDSFTIVLDTTDLLETTNVAVFVLLLFFDIVAIISSVMCFFVLWLSFTSNITENSWEFGVLRAIGLSANQVTRVYIYEALCIIISALILGSATGLGIAITLTLQFNLFTEMPFHFDFPYLLFFSVVIMSILVAIGGSYLASRDIKKLQIAQVLKGSL